MLNKHLSSREVMMFNNQLKMMMTVKARKVKVKALHLCVPAEEGPLKNLENLVLMSSE